MSSRTPSTVSCSNTKHQTAICLSYRGSGAGAGRRCRPQVDDTRLWELVQFTTSVLRVRTLQAIRHIYTHTGLLLKTQFLLDFIFLRRWKNRLQSSDTVCFVGGYYNFEGTFHPYFKGASNKGGGSSFLGNVGNHYKIAWRHKLEYHSNHRLPFMFYTLICCRA